MPFMESLCERTGEALIRALQDDIRLLTLLKSELDAEIESHKLMRNEDSVCEEVKRQFLTVPRTSTSPWMDIIPSNSADRASQVSPTTITANTPFLSP
ncbi:hypothetical protein K443DRAFT_622386, partial [Laccaria amethystina LaAM-08-1]